jgi:type IV secretory pathway VirB10-like protein
MNMKKLKLMRNLLIGLVIAGCMSNGYAVLEKEALDEEKEKIEKMTLEEKIKKMTLEEKIEKMGKALDKVSARAPFAKAVEVDASSKKVTVNVDLLRKWAEDLDDLCNGLRGGDKADKDNDVEKAQAAVVAERAEGHFLGYARSYVAYYLDAKCQNGSPCNITNEDLLALTKYIRLPKDIVSKNAPKSENKECIK